MRGLQVVVARHFAGRAIIAKAARASLIGIAGLSIGGCHALSHPSLAPYQQILARPAGPRAGLTVRFLGTSSIVFDDGQNAIMIDGFLTRPSAATLLLGRLRPNRRRISFALEQAHITRLSAIFVAHSHHDHAMDAPYIAMRTGAVIMGSQSTAYIAEGAGLAADRIRILRPGQIVPIGRFSVSVFQTPHSPNAKFEGAIPGPLRQPARVGAYREGGNYSFLVQHGRDRILVVPSANFTPGALANVPADVVFLSIGTLGRQSAPFVEDYWRETVRASAARLVIPIHWDDFMRPLDRPLVPMPHAMDDFDLGMRLVLELARRDGVRVRLPEAFTPIDLHQ
jgi:L-ascorbate metabolism protein UlaG (beta-lactamase superfamily)